MATEAEWIRRRIKEQYGEGRKARPSFVSSRMAYKGPPKPFSMKDDLVEPSEQQRMDAQEARRKALERVRGHIERSKGTGFVEGATGRYLRRGGGKISEARPKSELEWIILRARSTPGPNSYSIKYSTHSQGALISDANAKSDLDWTIHRARETPGPSAYNPKLLPSASNTTKISDAEVLDFIDMEVMRSRDIPGPAAYDVSRCAQQPSIKRSIHSDGNG